jgi:hypothetical protein
MLIARFVIPLPPRVATSEGVPDQVICHSYIIKPATTTYITLPFSSSLSLCKYNRAHTYHLHHTTPLTMKSALYLTAALAVASGAQAGVHR